MNPTPNHIDVNYNWFGQYVGKESVILKIESEDHKSDIFNKGL